MPFTYTVPLTAFQDLFQTTKPSRHNELSERIRAEIHGDLARRILSPYIGTPMGRGQTNFDSVVEGGEIIIFSSLDYNDVAMSDKNSRSSMSASSPPKQPAESLQSSMMRRWRYPGDGGDGVFAASVNAVMARSTSLRKGFMK